MDEVHASLGSREPVFANNTAANRARNRRIEIFVAESQSAQPVQPVHPPQAVVERCNSYASQQVTGKTEEVVKDAGIGALGGAARLLVRSQAEVAALQREPVLVQLPAGPEEGSMGSMKTKKMMRGIRKHMLLVCARMVFRITY
jgi:hypothetical protein